MNDGDTRRHDLYDITVLQANSLPESITPCVSKCFCNHGVIDPPGIKHEVELETPRNGFSYKYFGPALFICEIEGLKGTDFLSKNEFEDVFEPLLLDVQDMESSAQFAEQHESEEGESKAHFVVVVFFLKAHEGMTEKICAAIEARCQPFKLSVIRAVVEHLEGREDQIESWVQRKQKFVSERGRPTSQVEQGAAQR